MTPRSADSLAAAASTSRGCRSTYSSSAQRKDASTSAPRWQHPRRAETPPDRPGVGDAPLAPALRAPPQAYNSEYLQTYTGHHMAVYTVRWNPFNVPPPLSDRSAGGDSPPGNSLPRRARQARVFLSCSADWTVRMWDHTRPSCLLSFELGNQARGGDAPQTPLPLARSCRHSSTAPGSGRRRGMDALVVDHLRGVHRRRQGALARTLITCARRGAYPQGFLSGR